MGNESSSNKQSNAYQLNRERRRWYHGMIEDDKAELTCRNVHRGAKNNKSFQNGSFMVYNNPDINDAPYKLLVYYKEEILRYKISSFNGEFFLHGAEDPADQTKAPKFRLVVDLVGAYRRSVEHQLTSPGTCANPNERFNLHKELYIWYPRHIKIIASDQIEEEREVNSKPNKESKEANDQQLSKKKWYHGKISDIDAKTRLQETSQNIEGAYLLYDNPTAPPGAPYVLLVYFQGDHLRWKISEINGKFFLGEEDGEKFTTVKMLIKAHRGITGRPIRLENNKLVTLSKCYVQQQQQPEPTPTADDIPNPLAST